jgi:protein involved in ribonucleotide reduction
MTKEGTVFSDKDNNSVVHAVISAGNKMWKVCGFV